MPIRNGCKWRRNRIDYFRHSIKLISQSYFGISSWFLSFFFLSLFLVVVVVIFWNILRDSLRFLCRLSSVFFNPLPHPVLSGINAKFPFTANRFIIQSCSGTNGLFHPIINEFHLLLNFPAFFISSYEKKEEEEEEEEEEEKKIDSIRTSSQVPLKMSCRVEF